MTATSRTALILPLDNPLPFVKPSRSSEDPPRAAATPPKPLSQTAEHIPGGLEFTVTRWGTEA
ncbi:hypothetical protein CU254_32415 [Amycolatopsis sp. AA4]|uniref:hypothetical protein n=1 Tax=Actinomycetes TaxID=1760 RepID=UPI0001B55BAA|nr:MULTISPECIES: hypothetical protein [Actinomycetes]ATY14598.1 hypothetical protein CU254_32415 [Amycolatopsis sp. AA4]